MIIPKIGCMILCRYNSRRLPGKILYKINNKVVLDYIYERVNIIFKSDDIFICTSIDQTDDCIIKHCEKNNYLFYRGDLNNVAERFLNCGLENGFDYIVRINGDNIFVDPKILKKMCKYVGNFDVDFITNVPGRSFPIGMSVEIIKTKFLKMHIKNFLTDDLKEHVTKYFYENEVGKRIIYKNDICQDAKGLKLAIDDQDSLRLIEKIISQFESSHVQYGILELYSIINKLK